VGKTFEQDVNGLRLISGRPILGGSINSGVRPVLLVRIRELPFSLNRQLHDYHPHACTHFSKSACLSNKQDGRMTLPPFLIFEVFIHVQ